MRQRLSAAVILALLTLMMSLPVLAETDWPAFITEHFPADAPPYVLQAALSAVHDLPGQALDGEIETEGLTMRTHYATFDGVELLVLFSLEGEDVETLPIIPELPGGLGEYGVAFWQDEEAGRVWGLTQAICYGRDWPGENQLPLSLHNGREAMPGLTLPIPLEGYAAPSVPVRVIPLDQEISFAAPEEGEETELSTLEAMMPTNQGVEVLNAFRLRRDEAVLYQNGVAVLYTFEPLTDAVVLSHDNAETMLFALLKSLDADWQGDALGGFSTWGGVQLHEEGGRTVGKGNLRVSQPFTWEDQSLTLTLTHPRFAQGEARVTIGP